MNKLTEFLTKPFLEEDVLNEGARDPGIFKAIFLAGGPGSGKSFVAQKLFGIPEKINVSKTGLKMVNQDNELELLLKKYFGTTDIDNMPDELFADLTGVDKQGKPVDYDTSGLRKFAKSLSKERLRLYTNGKLGVIIDGTGHNFSKIKSRRKELMDMGYDTYMVFVNTNLDVALERNEKRDRVVPASIVRKSWQDVQDNMGAFQGLFGGSNFMIVQNNKMLSDAQIKKHFKMLVSKGIDSFLKKPIKSKIGKAWLRRQKKHQKVFKDPGQSRFFESIEVPVEIGDTIKMGRFKNKKVVVKTVDWNEKGDLLINGRSALKFRIEKKVDESKAELYKLYSKAMKMIPGSANQKKIKKQIADLRKKLGMNEAQKTITSKSFDKKRESGAWTVIGHMKKKGKSTFHVRDEKTKKRFDVRLIEQKSKIKKTIGVFGGRFQPFHSGHLATYNWLKKQVDEVYITTSNIKQPPRHPMDFKEKVRHMTKMGIPKNRIVMEKSPYVAKNLLSKFNKDTTAVVYAFGKKDAGRLKAGKGKYFQDYKKSKGNINGYEENGYFITAPQFGSVSGTQMRQLLGDPKVDDSDRVKGFKQVFGYYDKGIYNMMTNKFRKLFEVLEQFIIDVDIKKIINEGSYTATNPTDDGPPTFYRGFSDYKKHSKEWIDDMYKNDGWEVVQYILSQGAINPDFDYTLKYNVVPAVAYGREQSGRYGSRFGVKDPIGEYQDHISNTVLKNLGYELVKWMGITPDNKGYTGVEVETPVFPGVGEDNVDNTDKKKLKLKEAYKAVSVDTGYDSTFKTKQAMQKAIKNKTHVPVKQKKKSKYGLDPEKMKAIAAKAAAKAKKKAKTQPKKDTPDTDGFTPPGNTWNNDREPNIGEDGIDQITRRDEQFNFSQNFLNAGDDMNSDKMQKYHDRMTERYEKQKESLSPEQQEKRKRAIHSWKIQGGYQAIQLAIKDGRTTQKEIEERNDIISEASHNTITKVDGSIERGIHVSPEDIDDLLDDFVVGELVEIPDEDGHGASGFSISATTARHFTNQRQQEGRCYDKDGCKTSVLFRIKPNSNGELRGLYIDGEKDQQGDYWHEGEITRSSKSKAKVISVEKVRNRGGKMTVIITLQEPDDLTESYVRTFSKRSAELSKKYLEGPVNPKPKKKDVKEDIKPDVIKSFVIRNSLNTKLWKGGKLKPEIRKKLLIIAKNFFKDLELEQNVDLKDITLTGSISNYNWSKFSDVDLHLRLDFSQIDDDEDFVKNYVLAKKTIWNNKHDIKIFGFPVEVYVENLGDVHIASGLYSILKDKWIVVPKKKELQIDLDDIRSKAEGYLGSISVLKKMMKDGKYEEVISMVDKIKERLKRMRSSGLARGGEFSVENLAFKALRRSPFIATISDMKTMAYDKKMTMKERINLDEEVKLLIEGGAYGHLNHPFDDKNLTFSDFKTLIINTLQGNLDSEGAVTEKTDGQNIMISWKNGKLIAARNKGHIKNHGANALSVSGIKNMFAGRGEIETAFVSAMRDLEKALKGLSKKQKDKIFGEGKKFMSLEVIYPKTANVIPYDKSLLQFHGTIEYDTSGTPVGEDRGSARMLAGMIKQINQNIQKTYSITKPFVTNLPKVKNFSKRQSYFLGKLNKLQSEYQLSDKDTLADYHQAYWMEYIYNGGKQTDYKNPSNNVLIKLTKRWAFLDKSYKIPQIRKDLEKYPKFLDWVLKTDKMDLQKLQKQHIRDWEVLFFELGAEILSNLSDFIAANPSKSAQQIRKDLKSAISKVKKSKDPKVLNTLKVQLDRLNAIGGLKSVVPSEGITFVYKGKLYKYTGAFAPANQILGMLKFV